jgi:tetratricopeptide (TPR) repeat protein
MACFEQALGALAHLPKGRETLEQAIDLRVDFRQVLFPLGEIGRGFEYLHEAETLAQALGDQRRLGRVSASMTHYFWLACRPDRAIESGQRALEIAEALDDFPLQIDVNFHLGLAYNSLGDYRRALKCLGRNVASLQGELVRERFGLAGLPSVFSRSWSVNCFSELGEFAEAIAPGEEAVRIAEAVDHPFSLIRAYLELGSLYAHKGEFPKAIPLLERGLGVCQVRQILFLFPWIDSALGHAYALAGRVAEALPLLEGAAERDASMRLVAHQSIRVTYLSEAYLLAGRMDDATRFAGRALDLSRNHKERGHEAYVLRLLGEIAAHRDPSDVEAGKEYYRQAMALADELGMRPLVAHCHLGLGQLCLRTGKGPEAREHLTTAASLYREMDMQFWLEKAESVES